MCILIRDAPKLKLLAEAEQNETLGWSLYTKHGFSCFFSNVIVAIFFTIAYIY